MNFRVLKYFLLYFLTDRNYVFNTTKIVGRFWTINIYQNIYLCSIVIQYKYQQVIVVLFWFQANSCFCFINICQILTNWLDIIPLVQRLGNLYDSLGFVMFCFFSIKFKWLLTWIKQMSNNNKVRIVYHLMSCFVTRYFYGRDFCWLK